MYCPTLRRFIWCCLGHSDRLDYGQVIYLDFISVLFLTSWETFTQMPLLTRQDPLLELFKFLWFWLVVALTKTRKDPGWNIESFILFNFLCYLCALITVWLLFLTLLVPLFALIFLCSPVFVDMYTTKQVFCSSCSVATVFSVSFWHFCCHKWKWKKNTNNNSHALRQKENPKTKHFHHWCINMRKEASLYLRICCCF